MLLWNLVNICFFFFSSISWRNISIIWSCFLVLGVLPKYFHSEWSVAQFRLHENTQYIVAFGHQKNTIVILGMDGRYELIFPYEH